MPDQYSYKVAHRIAVGDRVRRADGSWSEPVAGVRPQGMFVVLTTADDRRIKLFMDDKVPVATVSHPCETL